MIEPDLTPTIEPLQTAGFVLPPWVRRFLLPALFTALIFGIGLGSGWLIWGRAVSEIANTTQENAAPGNGAQIQIPEKLTRYDVPIDDDPMLGPEDAPITLVAFSDYQCPYCKKWHDQVFKQLMKDYEGKLRFVYRDFPLSQIHPQAAPAAQAANCANEQGAYWEYHDALFSYAYELNEQGFEQYARELNLDTAAFLACIQSGRYATEVDLDMQFASGFGITSTPTFFLNGIAIVGAQPYDVFKQIIDLELAGKLPK